MRTLIRLSFVLLLYSSTTRRAESKEQMEFRNLVAGLIVAAITTPAAAQRIVDGDTIDLNGTRWRLWGIDAPGEPPDLQGRMAGRR